MKTQLLSSRVTDVIHYNKDGPLTHRLSENIYWINPDALGRVEDWTITDDNDGQVVIYTDQFPAEKDSEGD